MLSKPTSPVLQVSTSGPSAHFQKDPLGAAVSVGSMQQLVRNTASMFLHEQFCSTGGETLNKPHIHPDLITCSLTDVT